MSWCGEISVTPGASNGATRNQPVTFMPFDHLHRALSLRHLNSARIIEIFRDQTDPTRPALIFAIAIFQAQAGFSP
jgi:hypothetical protein